MSPKEPAASITDGPPGRVALEDELSLPEMARLLRRERRFVATFGVVLMLLVVGFTVLRGRTYTSTAVFVPQNPEGTLSQFSGLAAQFGLPVTAADPSSSPAFYVSLLKSRDVLREVVLSRYRFAWRSDTLGGTLIDLYEASGKTPEARRDATVKRLLDDLEIMTDRETGMVSIEVTTPWSPLSQQVAARLIEMVSHFNLLTRQTRAGAERRFVEARLKEAADSLRLVENRHKAFLQANRDFRNSPQLKFENDRLERDVQFQQQLYTSLAQSYEQARIDEVRNTPVITVLEPPDLPASPDPRRTILKALLGLIGGLALGFFLRLARHLYSEASRRHAVSTGPTRSIPHGESAASARLSVGS